MNMGVRDGLLRGMKAEFRSSKKIMLAAAKIDGFSLEFASKELRANREVVLQAVRTHGASLSAASTVLRKDREVCLAACAADGKAIQYPRFYSEILIDKTTQLQYLSSSARHSNSLRNNT
jgi:hypothetical protein